MAVKTIDSLLRTTGHGGTKDAITRLYKSLDARKIGIPYQKNTDHMGLVFFTRPRLNMTYDNLNSNPIFTPLIRQPQLDGGDNPNLSPYDTYENSMYAALRLMLDSTMTRERLPCNLFDHGNPFITILSNTLMSLSGWPDITLDYYTAPEGIRKESFTIIDSIAETNQVFNLTATFANVEGDPITSLFHYWTTYIGSVYVGDLVPYPDSIIENEKDYNTRVWRIVLDKSQRYIRKIASCIATPLVTPFSANLTYNRDQPFANESDQLSIPFVAEFAEYNNPLLYREFNMTVEAFNPHMKTKNGREQHYHKLEPNEVIAFNWEGAIPYIDLVTLELQWWVSLDVYHSVLNDMNSDAAIKTTGGPGYLSSILNTSR